MTPGESLTGTVTKLLKELHTGDELVVKQVFDFYFQQLAGRAKILLQRKGVRVKDEEGLASLVMEAFLRDATAGEIGELRSRHDVWRMLAKRIDQRASNIKRYENQKKRKGEVGESVFRAIDGGWDPLGLQQQVDRSTEIEALHRELIESLNDELHKQIVHFLLNGDSVKEIAEKTGKSPQTIYRKMTAIISSWKNLS
jgi:hypothetical protein